MTIRPRRIVRARLGEGLESRNYLTAVSFIAHEFETAQWAPTSLFTVDWDNDRDLDVVAVRYQGDEGRIAWYENLDGRGTFGAQRLLEANRGLRSAQVADVDGDGDPDLLSTWRAWNALEEKFESALVWHENTGSAGTLGPRHVIADEDGKVQYAGDLDGDGDLDVIVETETEVWNSETSWYENIDGEGEFGTQKLIGTELEGGVAHAADLDLDGDLDVVLAFGGEGYWFEHGGISWYENTDGAGSFTRRPVTTPEIIDFAHGLHATDFDGDGDSDLLSALGYAIGQEVAWYENADEVYSQHSVTDQLIYAAVAPADVDGDGDPDVLAAGGSAHPGSPKGVVAWYENSSGAGDIEQQHVIANLPQRFGQWSLCAADIDGDGDADVLVAWPGNNGSNLTWYENRLAGDADDNGRVDFEDYFALSLNFGKTDAGWREADFNGDGKVAFVDFLILANAFGRSRT